MSTVTKIAPRREGQVLEDIRNLEERMHYLIGRIAESERILRVAEEERERLSKCRAELANLTAEYYNLITKGAELWVG